MFDNYMGGVYVCQGVFNMGGIAECGYDGEIELKIGAVSLLHLYI